MDNDHKENPMFSSTNIESTKSRAGNTYFTNVEKASFWQKLSTKYAKYQKSSEAKQKAQSAAFREKRAKKRQAADLKAMSVNIPIAAENGNPALMNTHYAPRPRAKTRPATAILLILLMGILIAGIVVAIMKPWEPEKKPLSTNYPTTSEEDEPTGTGDDDVTSGGYDIADFEVEVAASNEGPIYVNAVMAAADTDIYVYKDGAIDVFATVDHIDEVVKDAGITDPNILLLFELTKARLYATTSYMEEAKAILEPLKEADLLEVQLGMYYDAYYYYYAYLAEHEQAQVYKDKLAALRTADGLGEEE